MARLLLDLTPLRVSAPYRRLWAALGISNIGQQMTSVAVGLQVWDITESSFMVGLVGLAQLIPLIGFGLYGGTLSDAFDRRLVGLASAIGLWGASALLLLQSLAGWQNVYVLYLIVGIASAFFAVGNPARQAIIPRLIEPQLLPAANALSMITWNLGFALGPVLGGLLVAATGTVTTAYAIDVVAFALVAWAMFRLPSLPPIVEPGSARPKAGWASVREGFAFLRGKRNLQMTFYQDIVAMVFGMPRALFPAIAAQWYGGTTADVALVLGLLSAAPAAGALLSGLLSGWLVNVRWQGRAIVIAIIVWGTAIAAFGFVRVLWIALICLAIAGAADNVSAVFRSTILQAATPDEYRGRLQGVFTVVVAGGPRLGDVEAGTVAALGGEMVSVVSGGVLCVAGAIGLVAKYPGFLKYDARHPVP
ncbi:MAG TPA: MFS transporter [Actinobacteria bacterium]|nr:MFS transporter [Actinomycetota bacterium]